MQGLEGESGVNDDDLVPPGFRPKRVSVDTGDSSEDDERLTLGEFLRSERRASAAKNCSAGDRNDCTGIHQPQSFSLQNAESADVETRGTPMEPVEMDRPHDTAAGGAQRDNEEGEKGIGHRFTEGGLVDENAGASSYCLTCEMLAEDLEARISKLERAAAEPKAQITK